MYLYTAVKYYLLQVSQLAGCCDYKMCDFWFNIFCADYPNQVD